MTPAQLRRLAQDNEDAADFLDTHDPAAATALREAAHHGRNAARELAEEIERVG